YDNDVYLLHICDEWQTKNKQHWPKLLRFLSNLIQTEHETKDSSAIFRVIDHDLHADLDDKPDQCVIFYAKQGIIESRNFYQDSLQSILPKQIKLIRKQNPSLSEAAVLELHNKFISRSPTGELTKAMLIAALKEVYSKGNVTNYCNYAFSKIDKDKSGTITFVEFMSAIALTQPDNVDKRLEMVFFMCDEDNSNAIDAEEIIKFIEVISELEDEKNAIDISTARSIVTKMMEICGKSPDDNFTKEEFLRCCKTNEQVCAAFLPNTAKIYRVIMNQLECNLFIIQFLLEINVKPTISESTKTESSIPINTLTLDHCNINLLKDDQWIKTNFSLEKIPDGCEPLYDEFNQIVPAWATSYQLGTFKQDHVKLFDDTQSPLLSLHPVIEFSVCIAARKDCGAKATLSLTFSDGHVWNCKREYKQWNDGRWHRITYRYSQYKTLPTDVTVVMQGCDTKYWAGYFGMKFAQPCLQLVLNNGTQDKTPKETDVIIKSR
ncbi:unnamed protein product, partial [Adineta ricciae]